MVNKRREEETEEELEEESTEQVDTRGNGHQEMSDAEVAAFQKRELSKKIPGFGNLFHVDNEFLHESARLSKQAIFGFAARDMQQEVLNPQRTLSAWDIFKFRFMGYTISEDGKGRDESITLHHLTTEEKEAATQGGLYDHG
jgi:hypothetical protein